MRNQENPEIPLQQRVSEILQFKDAAYTVEESEDDSGGERKGQARYGGFCCSGESFEGSSGNGKRKSRGQCLSAYCN